jgi:hypothetical protein
MPLDLLEPGLVGRAKNGVGVVGGPAPRLNAQELKFDLAVKVLQRDDPLRRSYLQSRWQSQAVGRSNIEGTSAPPIVLSRR